MGMIKRIERSGKHLLIRIVTSLVHTPRRSREEILAAPPRRILLIRQHNQMGDMLLAVPALRAIKETFPHAELGVLTATINRDVLINHPYIDHLLTYDSRRPLGLIPLIRAMRRAKYDIVIVLHTVSFSFSSAVLGLVSGARLRVGSTSGPFGHGLSRSLFHLDLPLPDARELEDMNEAEHNLYPLAALGIHTDNIAPVLRPTPDDETWAETYFRSRVAAGAATVLVHPGAGKMGNIWPPENFAGVVNRMAETHPLVLFVVQGPRDADPVRRFAAAIKTPHHVVAGRRIGEVAALMRRTDLVICNDTGVMHVACAAGANTLAVFGPTDPGRWAPRCANLRVVRAEDGDLTHVSVDDVLENAVAALKAPSTSTSG